MNVYDLARKLKVMYSLEKVNKTAMIHLFGVIYADFMAENNITASEVVRLSGISSAYVTEVNKGKNLSEYVEIKDKYKSVFLDED